MTLPYLLIIFVTPDMIDLASPWLKVDVKIIFSLKPGKFNI